MRLSREALLSAPDIKTEELEVPEWGGSVVLQSLTLEQTAKITAAGKKKGAGELDTTLMALIEGLAEPKLDPGDIPALRAHSAGVLARLGKRIMEMSGLSDVAAEVDKAEGN